MDGNGKEDLALRRNMNKKFLNILVKVHLDHSSMLVWLKKYVDSHTCGTMLGDSTHSGEFLKQIMQDVKIYWLFNHFNTRKGSNLTPI